MDKPLEQASLPDTGWKQPSEILAETEEYAKNSTVVNLFRDMALQTFKSRPEDPPRFLVSYLAHNYPVAASEALFERQQRVVEKHEKRDEELTVTVSHKEHELQEYLVHEVGLERVMKSVAEALIKQRPAQEDALTAIIQTLTDIQTAKEEKILLMDRDLNEAAGRSEEADGEG
jgi:hypothetical protein|uniref:RIIa domain-containing protein n=1 Tax=Tetraselmis chuii TaxID=63592 RepID=A0A6U1IS53_9CHLO|mmetsp:Transcript_3388/g.6185  ORF Transcript_3388/g.6185 Transcript_3388/m.6185 type:complete len:174 (+) Transcript_3388:147-668(+)